jgi:hypothetical protein
VASDLKITNNAGYALYSRESEQEDRNTKSKTKYFVYDVKHPDVGFEGETSFCF